MNRARHVPARAAAPDRAARRQTQTDYRGLVEHAANGIFRATAAGRFLYVNPSLARTFGYASAAEMLSCAAGLAARRFLRAEDRKRLLCQIEQHNSVDGFETQIRRQDQEIAWVSITARTIRCAHSRRRFLEGTIKEISAHKQLELEVRAHATQLGMALDAAEMVTWEWNIPLGVVRYSANAPAIMRGQAIQPYTSLKALMRKLHPDDREQLSRALDRTAQEGAPFECEYRVRMLDGIYHWILGRGKIVITEGGKPVRVLGVSQEITRRKQTELVLQLQRDLATALSQVADLDAALNKILEMALLIHGVDGGGIYLEQSDPPGFRLFSHQGLSPKFTDRVGFYPSDSPGAKMMQGQAPWYALPEELRERLDPVLVPEGILGLAVVPLHHEQRLIGCLNLASRHCREIPGPSRLLVEAIAGQAASAIARIQAGQKRKRLERQILEISEREQSRFGQDLHDGVCQLLARAAFDVKNLARQLAAQSLPTAQSAGQIAALLDQAITESRRLAHGLHPVTLEAEGLVLALEELAATSGAREGIACSVRCTSHLEVSDHAMATHLYRIAQEAVNNALKHSRARRITIKLTATPRSLRLEVRDDGRGITRKTGASAGMGLHIMDYRARSLGGRLTVGRPPGGGTLVSCSVPRTRR